MHKQLKKNNNTAPVIAELRVQEAVGEKRYKINTHKLGRLPDPVFAFVILTEWAVLILLRTEEQMGILSCLSHLGCWVPIGVYIQRLRTKDTLSLPLNRLPSEE